MAESVVSSVGQTIGKLLVNEAKYLWGVKGQVEDLQKELERIQGLLRDADARQEHNQAVRKLVAQLRDIAYDAEDVIEQYILRVAPKKDENIIKAYVCIVAKCMCVQAHLVRTKIDGLKISISNLARSMQNLGIKILKPDERGRPRASMPKLTYGHFEEDFFGREDSIKDLVEELLNEGEQHRVISIWGMGGLGKTTLAKKVFTHDEVKNHFHGFAWACISQEYDKRDILEKIFLKLLPNKRDELQKMKDDELVATLYETQQKDRYIVVLDDIWTEKAWDDLQGAFPVKNTRSKLLITTRNIKIAEYIDPHGFFYKPLCLSDSESWELLMKSMFSNTKSDGLSSVQLGVGQSIATSQPIEGIARQEETEEQIRVFTRNEKLAYKLLKKCGGLPLAIIVLGGLLAIKKREIKKWGTVYENIKLHFVNENVVSKVLAFSYDDLPWHLKPCFLYLGIFPKDVEIPVMKVFHMWIAEGFVSTDAYDKKTKNPVEDVAEQYLTELVKRGMVQVRLNLSGKIKTCYLHDMMREFCISKARQESFLSNRNIQQDNEREDCPPLTEIKANSTCKIRRVSLRMRKSAEGNRFPTVKPVEETMLHLRTFMFFGSVHGEWMQLKPVFINCKFLRVLRLEDLLWMRGNLPESVGDLIHLRYLSLAESGFRALPQSMGNLLCMEFLDLKSDFEIIMPNVLWKMRKLRYLHLPKKIIMEKFDWNQKKLRLDTLKNLRILRNFCPKKCDLKDVGKLTDLQILTVVPQNGSDKLEMIPLLAKFNLKLESSSFGFFSNGGSFTEDELRMTSSCSYSCKLSILGKIVKLPEDKNLPQQLRKLVLADSRLEEDPMPILEKLQYLVVLMLGKKAYEGKEMVCSGGFPQLKHLVFYFLPNLEELRVAEGAMPLLSRLGISKCPKLNTLPQGVHAYDGSEDYLHEYMKCE